jgi:excisionase family DNA binding protein
MIEGPATCARRADELVGRRGALMVYRRDEGISNSRPTERPRWPRVHCFVREQAAHLLSVKTSWVYEAVRSGRVPCIRVGRHIRFTRQMLEDWLAEQQRQ